VASRNKKPQGEIACGAVRIWFRAANRSLPQRQAQPIFLGVSKGNESDGHHALLSLKNSSAAD
jgi:hypothetical protein